MTNSTPLPQNPNDNLDTIGGMFKNMFDSGQTPTPPLEKESDSQNAFEPQEATPVQEPIQEVLDESIEGEDGEDLLPTPEELVHQEELQLKRKFSKAQREKKKYEHQLRMAHEDNIRKEQELQILRTQLETSSQAAMFHNEEKLKLEYSNLLEQQKRAKEIGDVEAEADISLKIGRLGAKFEENDRFKAEQAAKALYEHQMQQAYGYQQPYAPPPVYNEQPESQITEETRDWLERNNDWLTPQSMNYDPQKFQVFQQYINDLDAHLMDTGQHHLYQTDTYYNYIDNHMSKKFPSSQARGQLSMNRSSSPVAPVRRSGSGNYTKSAPKLSRDAVMMANNMGIDPKMLSQQLEKQQREYQQMMKNGDLGRLKAYARI